MIKAASLVYALFIVTLVALLCSAFILASYFHNTHLIDIKIKTEQLAHLQSGVRLLQANYRTGEYFSENKQLFPEDELSEVLLQRKPWGAFELISSENHWKTNKLSKRILLGIAPDSNLALYLADLKRALSLSGKTIIKGEVYLPEAGVKRAYIEGNSFKGSKLIQGISKKSITELPELNVALLNSIQETKERKHEIFYDSSVTLASLNETKEWENSFERKTILIKDTSDIRLSNIQLKGNFVIQSEGSITVEKTALLEHIILMAPRIEFATGFQGSLQAFAEDSLIAQENCEFNYPSVLGIVGKQNSGTQLMEVKANTSINGILVQQREEVATNDLSYIKLEEDATVHGTIYCKGKVLLKGKVFGGVYCNLFTLATASSIYENHLLNTEIDVTKRSPNFIDIPLLEKDKTKLKEIVIELY